MASLIATLTGIVSLALTISGFILHLAGIFLVFDFTQEILGLSGILKYIVAPVICFVVSLIPFSEFWIVFYPILFKAINHSNLSEHPWLNIPWWIWFSFFALNLLILAYTLIADRDRA